MTRRRHTENFTPAPGPQGEGRGLPPAAEPTKVVTQIEDHLTKEVLVQLEGAVVLPRGTVVELADGDCVQVQSLALIAPDFETPIARLVTHVIRTSL